MQVTEANVETQRAWVIDRADVVVPVANEVRSALAEAFDVELPTITQAEYREAMETVFGNASRAMNVAALVALLRDLDVVEDYPGFVIDEYLGRELAALIAGDQPLRLLGEATFHFADISLEGDGTAGEDDLDAALAAGVQTRLPGWSWRSESPFGDG